MVKHLRLVVTSVILMFVSGIIPASLSSQITFVPNQQQWDERVLYKSDISGGHAFFGENRVTYTYYCTEDLKRTHEHAEVKADTLLMQPEHDDPIRCFAFEVAFVGAQTPELTGDGRKKYNVNYFTGNDQQRWASNVPVYSTLTYSEIYPGIDLQYYGSKKQLKYDFIVSPGSDPSQIRMQYNGLQSIRTDGENLLLDLGFTQIREMIPYSYQVRDGVREEVKCRFSLVNNEVFFVFPDGYNSSLPLVIDPVIIASTYSGGTGVTGGLSATYDDEGNIYSGGDAFSTGFPVTLGAFSVNFNGSTDLAISKYNPDGSSLLYCTYIGGSAMEFPQSLIVSQGILYINGGTFSSDFPVTSLAYDQVIGGVCDMYICCLDNSGSALIGSTYVGGSWGDGINLIAPFYPDRLRGELQVAANGDVLVCGSTLSQDFPATPGAYSTSNEGGQDAVVFRMNSVLTTMIWATYLGSGVHDIALGIRESADGSIYVCGGSNNYFGAFPTVAGCYNTTPMGGTDAFVVKLDASGTTLLAGTFYGGALLDIAFFIDLDADGDVYIFGISRLGTPVTDGVFSVPGAPNFIAKLNASLTELVFSTVIGSPTNSQMTIGGPTSPPPPSLVGPAPIRPSNNALTAFMVDECERIYIAGYVGISRWPTTDNALFEYSGDNQFCVAVLEEDATALVSSTMYSGLHVDGGKGRFDRNGVLYQASCVGDQYFHTVPWAFSDSSFAGAWDICVFKIDMHSDLIDSVSMPNIFTPNNDGINDQFIPGGGVASKNFSITVYNRNGTEMFSSTDPLEVWDGTHDGNPCPDGVYYYAMHYYFCTELREKHGFVHLVGSR